MIPRTIVVVLLGLALADDIVPIQHQTGPQEVTYSLDTVEDSFYDPLTPDPSCDAVGGSDCWSPPRSTVETETVVVIDATAMYGGDDPSVGQDEEDEKTISTIVSEEKGSEKISKTVLVDKHWGSDETILKMRDKLRYAGRGTSVNNTYSRNDHGGATTSDGGHSTDDGTVKTPHNNKRPPVFLMPGLASTRLVSWKPKACPNPLMSDVRVLDYVWMNINILLQMATIDVSCFAECMTLGLNQTDMNDDEVGCKLRPDEGLDAISSLAPGSIGSNLLVGGTNTVYAWLIQWLADNLGYDVSSIVGLPYDWRLSPDVMEQRDGFLTMTRRRIEAAVASNGGPGIMVAHSVRS